MEKKKIGPLTASIRLVSVRRALKEQLEVLSSCIPLMCGNNLATETAPERLEAALELLEKLRAITGMEH